MLSYAIAIRTLGTAGDKFRKELESIKAQHVKPEKVMVYIAEGYKWPDYRIGEEEYRTVKKGMMKQRLLPYDDIESDLILFLDDDVELAPESVAKMIEILKNNQLDAIGADVFQNHKMSLRSKLFYAFVNLVTPRFNNKWAFKIKKNGTFSYIQNPKKDWYPSQSCGGPAWMIRKSVYHKLRLRDELWLEKLKFPYCEDQLETYKIYKNGYKLGVLYNSGISNLDAKTESDKYQKNKNRIYIRSKASFSIWWRSIFKSSDSYHNQIRAGVSFVAKSFWMILPLSVYSLKIRSFNPISQYIKGTIDGWRLVHSQEFLSLPPYVIA